MPALPVFFCFMLVSLKLYPYYLFKKIIAFCFVAGKKFFLKKCLASAPIISVLQDNAFFKINKCTLIEKVF